MLYNGFRDVNGGYLAHSPPTSLFSCDVGFMRNSTGLLSHTGSDVTYKIIRCTCIGNWVGIGEFKSEWIHMHNAKLCCDVSGNTFLVTQTYLERIVRVHIEYISLKIGTNLIWLPVSLGNSLIYLCFSKLTSLHSKSGQSIEEQTFVLIIPLDWLPKYK